MLLLDKEVHKEAKTTEKIFNINSVLEFLYLALRETTKARRVDLVFDMDPTLPRRLRGDAPQLLKGLTTLLEPITQETPHNALVLAIHAPEDFFYAEIVTFRIEACGIDPQRLDAILKEKVADILTKLSGTGYVEGEDIIVQIPFKDVELGFRRHYRLPTKSMLGKKVLLVCQNDRRADTLKKKFHYFHYEVEIIDTRAQLQHAALEQYDIILVAEGLRDRTIEEKISTIQAHQPLKYVIMRDTKPHPTATYVAQTTDFIKPVTQEKVLHLIIALYDDAFSNTTHIRTLA
jgi:hypothetical protein